MVIMVKLSSICHIDEVYLFPGVTSLWMIVMIGYDRYNVIVKGFNGVKITPCVAFGMIMFAFLYSTGVCLVPLLGVWGNYTLEGLLLTCSFDYLTEDWVNKSFTLCFFLFCYLLPVLFICFFYSQIVAAVVNHERALKAQAKKMNVESLRSNEVGWKPRVWSIFGIFQGAKGDQKL